MSDHCCAMQPAKFEFYDPQTPIYTSPRFLPPAKVVHSKISDAIVSHGAFLEECCVENAIVGLRSRIGKGCTIRVSLHVGGSGLATLPVQCCEPMYRYIL